MPDTHSISSLGTAQPLKFKHSVTDYKLQLKLLVQQLRGNWFCSLTRTSASQSPLSELLALSHCPFFLIKLTVNHCLAHILLAHLTKPHRIPLAPPAVRLWGAAAEKSQKSRPNRYLQACGWMYCCLLAKLWPTLLRPHGLWPASLLCPWDSPGKNTGVDCHFLLQGIFLAQGLNPCPLHWQVDALPLSH